MDWVVIVVILALVEYIVFSMLVGRARGKFDVPAPATSGHPEFERYFRVQQNTAEQLIVFIPAVLLYAYVGNPLIAAGLGVVFIIGRAIYLLSYVKEPKSRGTGFAIGFLSNAILLVAGLVAAIGNLV